ncbi:MAG: cytochrome c biogenesis protein CcdA [Candidatus Paceibacterota bacterium]
MNKQLKVLIIVGLIVVASVVMLRSGNFGTQALWSLSNGGKWILPLVAVAALVDSINPCAFSILLLTIAFLLSIGKMRSGILKIGGSYIAGIFAVYILIGLGILQALHIFDTPHFMAKVGASLLILFGLISLLNEFISSFPIKFKIPHVAHSKIASLMERGSVPTAFLLGALVGLCEFPCTGGPYLMVLGLLHDQATFTKGLGYLTLYNLIFILPLVIILLIASNSVLLGKVKQWKKENTREMRLWGGLAMVILGIIIFLI